MIKAGLTSITFRSLSPSKIVDLAKEAGLTGIEWGGDVHVPHGDIYVAKEIRKMTQGAGMEIPSYGSYYIAGVNSINNPDFMNVLKTAIALNAREIRIWAGNKGLAKTDEKDWRNVISDSKRIAEIAESEGIKVAFEYHKNTLTENEESADKILKSIDNRNMYCYWQPCCGLKEDELLHGLKKISPYLSNIHVFNWIKENERRPLNEGEKIWQKYLDEVSKIDGERYAFLEFIKSNDIKQFFEDAATLIRIIANIK